MSNITQFPRPTEGARHAQLLIDNLRAAERAAVIPGINWRGATRDDCEITAFEIERLTAQYVASVRALVNNLNENLPSMPSTQINAESFLSDVFDGGHDLVSDVRGMADRMDDVREEDR